MPEHTADISSGRWRRFGAAVVALTLALLSVGSLPQASASSLKPTGSPIAAKDAGPQRPPSTASATPKAQILADRYIVELADGAAASELARDYRGTVSVRRRYHKVFTGFAAAMSATTAEELRADPRVTSVEADVQLTLSAVQTAPVWGLDRVDQRRRPLDDTYVYDHPGGGVSIYVVDTGVYRNHNQFGDRVKRGYDATGGGSTADCVGHGTHVAGTAAGATFGVAKRARIIPIRVLNCRGAGTKSQLIAGLDWLVRHHRRGDPAVANLSLGGPASRVVDRAVNRVLDDGVSVVAAAGNEGDTWWGNACDYSPARVRRAITVGAANRSDEAPLWSNFGPCLDLFAPGVRIRSAAPGGRSATATESGTSMAAPFVTGAAARYLDRFPSAGPRRVAEALSLRATSGIVAYAGQNTTQRLLYIPARVPTRINVSLSDSSVPLGDRTRVRATLRNAASRRPIAGKKLKVFHRRVGTRTWRHLANRTTNRDGRIGLRHQPLQPTQYRVRHAATSTTKPATSDIRRLTLNGKVRTRLLIRDTAAAVTYQEPVRVAGNLLRVWDDARLSARRVELQARRPGGSWRQVAADTTDANGFVVFRHTPRHNVRYRLHHDATERTTSASSGEEPTSVRLLVTSTISQGAELSGRVRPPGRYSSQRQVYVQYSTPDSAWWWTATLQYDAEGRFLMNLTELPFDPTSYRYRVRAPGNADNVGGVGPVQTIPTG